MLAPLDPSAWSLDHAAHLLNRAGFGGPPDQIRALHQLGLPRAVEALFNGSGPQIPAPEWTAVPTTARKEMMMNMQAGMDGQQQRELFKEAAQMEHRHVQELRSWWLERMREGRNPLLEKMTLFWHGHFATSIVKVKSAWLMWQQNETLRAYALGSFGEMLRAMTRDPAMIRWLDLGKSKSGEPNENFAREVLELFTLGEGHYTETDIKEAARAFTGHRIDPETQEFVFTRKVHDYGEKRFLGRSGNFNADDIAAIVLTQNQCSRFITQRVWEFLAYEKPELPVLDGAAAVFRESGHEIKPLLRAIFQSQAFYSKRAVRTQIKGPVDWLVNACIALGSNLPEQPALDFMLTRLGQLPFAPPNVRGWEGGKSWISSSTLVLRYNLAGYLAGSNDPQARRLAGPRLRGTVDTRKVAPEPMRNKPATLADAMVFRLFGTPQLPRMQQHAREVIALTPQPVSDTDVRMICQKLMSTPDFQLT
jgi:uncharacterized protein (DUF1800 family)